MDTPDATVDLRTHGPPAAALDSPPHCEHCGYEIGTVLESAGPESPCPECGRPLIESSPAARRGSPWQRRASLTSLWVTVWQTLRRPIDLFRSLAVTSRSSNWLLAIQCIVASVAFISPWSGVFVGDPMRQLRFVRTLSRALQVLSTVVLEILILAAALAFITTILGVLLNAYAKSRGWLLPKGMIRSILAHASIGWTVAASVVWSLLTFWFVATLVIPNVGSPNAARALGEASGWLSMMATRFGFLSLPVLVFGGGAALVARLAFIGLKECRFANAPETLALFEMPPKTGTIPQQ